MYPLITLTSTIQIPTYSLILSLVCCLFIFLGYRKAKQNQWPLRIALDFLFLFPLAGLLGARLFHIVYENPQFYLHNPLEVFYFWQGGFVYYGALITAFAFAFLYLRRHRQDSLSWLDGLAPVFSLCYALGRIACLAAGCCYGKICDLPWAIPMPDELGLVLFRHPTQLYLIFWEFFVFAILTLLQRLRHLEFAHRRGGLFFTWISLHSLGRFFIEFYRDDFRGIIWGLSISGWISLILFVASVGFLARKKTT